MSMQYLGETFDIHCGGIDHIPVHHTNEIAQSEGATHHPFVNYWMHGEFLLMNKEKISKSKGGSINTLQSLVDAGYDPMTYRYFCLQAHYRGELNFSLDALDAAASGLRKIYALSEADDPLANKEDEFQAEHKRLLEILNDDLSISQVIGQLHSIGSRRLWLEFDQVLGLQIEEHSRRAEEPLPQSVQDLITLRNTARSNRNWAESDAIRDQIIAMGFDVLDGPQGTQVKRKLLEEAVR